MTVTASTHTDDQIAVAVVADRVLVNMDFGGTIVELVEATTSEERSRLMVEVVELGAIIKRSGDTQSFAEVLNGATQRLEQTLDAGASRLPDEMRKGAEELLTELKKQLTAFDPARVDSVQSQIGEKVRTASGELVKNAVDDLLGEGGVLGRLLDRVTAQLELLAVADREIVERLGKLAERAETAVELAEAAERGTAKGVKFEDYLRPRLELIHNSLGDTVEHVSKAYGADNTQNGDFVIRINPRETRGRDVRIAVEAKTGRITGPKANDELEASLSNREAAAAILVFDDVDDAQSVLAGRRYGQRTANTFAVVLDPDDGQDLPLEVACRQARAIAIASTDKATEIDGQWLSEQCERLAGVIDSATDIKRGVNEARRGIAKIEKSYDELRDEAIAALDEIKERLAA